MATHHGSCACRAITWDFDGASLERRPLPVRRCVCDFCTRHACRWHADPAGRLVVRLNEPERVYRHRFATETADFYVCTRCGAVPLAVATDGGRPYAVINLNCLDGANELEFLADRRNFDGETTEERRARRRRTWIASVEFR